MTVNLMLDLFLSYEKLLVTSIQDLLVLIKKITEIKKNDAVIFENHDNGVV
jgi:hypothetical protein